MGLSDKQPGLLVAIILPALLSTVVVIVRTTRKMKKLPQYISRSGAFTTEILLILSVITGWISGACVLVSVTYGFGRHTSSILAEQDGMHKLVRAAFWQTTGYPFNVACYCLSVAGQVIHYRTWLFVNVDGYKTLSYLMNASGILQTVFGILCIISVFAKCTPVEANWNPAVVGTCWPQSAFLGLNYTSSALTFVAYMIQAWIPIHFALRLEKGKLSRNKWTALLVLSFWNITAAVLALVKIGFLHLYVENLDPTYSRVILVEIGLAENGASGIVPSAPEMWSLAQQLTNRTGSNLHTRSRDTGSDSRLRQKAQGFQRYPSSSSETELTDKGVGGLGKEIILKTTAWETTSNPQSCDSWTQMGDTERTEGLILRPKDLGDTRTDISHSRDCSENA